MANFTKNSSQIMIIIVLFAVIFGLGTMSYSSAKNSVYDQMTAGTAGTTYTNEPTAPLAPASTTGYALQPVASPSDLLPTDSNASWGGLNSINQQNIAMPDLLQAGYHIGLDTIGQTLRNANYQLRSDPVIPKSDVGPWNQSTIEGDYGRVPLELGACH